MYAGTTFPTGAQANLERFKNTANVVLVSNGTCIHCRHANVQKTSSRSYACSVYEKARSQKVLGFKDAGFRTKAAVIVLPDSSLFRRQRKQHQEEGKTVPEATIADMRGMQSVDNSAKHASARSEASLQWMLMA